MKTRKWIGIAVMLIGVNVAHAQTCNAGSSTDYRLDQVVVNAFGSTAAASADGQVQCMLFSGGEVIIGQSFSYSGSTKTGSAEMGFLNEYFEPIPTCTPKPFASQTPTSTITPTPTTSPTVTQTLFVTNTTTPTPKPIGYDEHRLRVYHSQINPMHHETAVIRWYQFTDAPTTIRIYNLLGNCVATLADNRNYSAGQIQEISWQGKLANGGCAASGIYVVRIQSGDYKEWTKIAVVK